MESCCRQWLHRPGSRHKIQLSPVHVNTLEVRNVREDLSRLVRRSPEGEGKRDSLTVASSTKCLEIMHKDTSVP